ncbi:MAG: hypothetical protein LC135_12910 [Phycisphaerae bacterium]|nr:hypothetical protein [Phycisphaerae bacterium]MCZ2400752.1 hypothetical protein [Phycisphaerae bacterium]NUQ48376.1 hypothetical protein [Phycisphaerae bacterium]
MSRVPGRLGLVMALGAACGGARTYAYADEGAAPMLRTALLDQVWRELATNDPFFDPAAPETRRIYAEHAAKLRETGDPTERIREVVRAISRFQDGHLALTTRWFLPDRPAPPLPLAGGEPLFRPRIGFERFHRHYYVWFAGVAAADGESGERDGAPGQRLLCRVVEIDGALVPFGGAWHMLNGPKDTPVTLLLERPDGTRFTASYMRTSPVVPPRFFAPTTQQVVVDEQTGERRVEEREVVIEARRLPDNLGYIRIEHLVKTQVVRDFNAALGTLMDTDGLILDLRDTGGGYPWIMLPIAGRFYDRYTPVARFSCRTPVMRELLRMIGPVGVIPWRPVYRKPLVVLVNDRTASMAEGLSFSLGDTGRAVLIGRPTMGLNAAIRNKTLANGLVLRHSWVRTDRLGRGHYQGVGVEPHERVELGVADVQRLGLRRAIAQERELQLERAVQRLRELAKAGGGP